MKRFPKFTLPPDLDKTAKAKFRQMVEAEPDLDPELLAMYARQYSILVSVRRERAKQEAEGVFSTTVLGRDSTQTLNPLLVAETRAIASLGRTLKQLGLTPAQQEPGSSRKQAQEPTPPGMHGPEPSWGWALEAKLCEYEFKPGGESGSKN